MGAVITKFKKTYTSLQKPFDDIEGEHSDTSDKWFLMEDVTGRDKVWESSDRPICELSSSTHLCFNYVLMASKTAWKS
jgi:hypothetical protein